LVGGSFINAGNDLYVSSPEFCFLQMACEYPIAKLIALGIEICGSYSLPSNTYSCEENGVSAQALYDLPKLTNKKKLKAFTSRMEGWAGKKQALKALNYIAEESASPMETILFILLTLPYRFGGYGLPMPEFNGCIYPKKGVSQFEGRSFYRGDLLWREAGVVVEYNSDMKHSDQYSMTKDAIRRNDMALCGFFEVTVTSRQINNTELFDKVAKQIAKRIGKELRYKEPGFSKARRELRSVLFQKFTKNFY